MKRILGIMLTVAMLLAIAAPASAATTVKKWHDEFHFVAHTCTGEDIEFFATRHFAVTTQRDGTQIQHINIHGTGISDLGNEYILKSNGKQVYESVAPFDFDVTSYSRIIGPGPNNNQQADYHAWRIGGGDVQRELTFTCRNG